MPEEREQGEAGPSAPAPEPFIAAATFGGAKEGYVFKLDDAGQGYYRDIPLADRIEQAKAEADAQKGKRPVVVKANNSLLKSLQKRGAPVSIPSGVPKKAKKEDDKDTPAYLKEMARFRSQSCASDTKHDRPLVK
ncbi:hypothetical protein HYH03_012266 [Edaphochlamys debaryana]|uniref:Uncharacterized protein n=1 Tax=Edaphochlamys debaryana TaxID=47281 RepID=A0A835XVS1_9CHLO|nr:hypothetical protein HYH03_012266 [Edaphochlamys debaryana]|eukprot:KAG2489246.1 hypothetical protein HYH03_012266 [Edaphochlamys debaryana]